MYVGIPVFIPAAVLLEKFYIVNVKVFPYLHLSFARKKLAGKDWNALSICCLLYTLYHTAHRFKINVAGVRWLLQSSSWKMEQVVNSPISLYVKQPMINLIWVISMQLCISINLIHHGEPFKLDIRSFLFRKA